MCDSSFERIRGHCRVINWPNFNIILSQGIGKPEEKEGERGVFGGIFEWL